MEISSKPSKRFELITFQHQEFPLKFSAPQLTNYPEAGGGLTQHENWKIHEMKIVCEI